MIYTYRCLEHPKQQVLVSRSMKEDGKWTHGTCSICGAPLEMDLRGSAAWFAFKMEKAGKWTGVYDFDYGKKATWDLTVPTKMAQLKAEGRIKDPFDSGPAPVDNFDLAGEI